MHIQISRDRRLDLIQKGAELFAAVASRAGADHASRLHIQGREQVCCVMAPVVMAAALNLSWTHRQNRRRALNGLNLRLLVHAQHQRPLRWIEVEPDHIPDLVDKGRIPRQLEGLLPVGLQPERAPDARHHGLAQSHVRGRAAGGPVSGGRRLGFQGRSNEVLDLIIADPARRAGAGRIAQSLQAMAQEALAPGDDALPADAEPLRNGRVGGVRIRTGEHDPRLCRDLLMGASFTARVE